MQAVGYGEAPVNCTVNFLKHVRRQAPAGWGHTKHQYFSSQGQRLCDIFNHRAIGPKAQHVATVRAVVISIDAPHHRIGSEPQHSVPHLAVASGYLVIEMNN